MKDLERENARLRRLVADLSLEKQVLRTSPRESEPRHRLDLWSLLDVYRATFEVMQEAALQMPFTLADEWLRLARS